MASIKHFVRDAWLTASYYSRVSHLYKVLAGRKSGIISYHNILPVAQLPNFDTYNVDTPSDIFEQQIIFLKKHFNILPIEKLNDANPSGFFLTVDDGMLNNYSILAPILEKHQIKVLFAICPPFASGDIPYIWRDHLFLLLRRFEGQKILLPIDNYATNIEILESTINTITRSIKAYIYQHKIANPYNLIEEIYHKNNWTHAPFTEDILRYQFMNWQQIDQLVKQGHQIASHTQTHRILKFLSADEKRDELYNSKQILERKLSIPIDILVYPYGSMSEIDHQTIKVAQEVGYKMAFMNIQNPLFSSLQFALPRFALPPTSNIPHLYGILSGYKNTLR